MPGMSRRRHFAAPFVITLATACSSKSAEPEKKINKNPPEPTVRDAAPIDAAVAISGPGSDVPPPPPPPLTSWTVSRLDKTKCQATNLMPCPPPPPNVVMSCNPPAPATMPCPDTMRDDEQKVTVVRSRAGTCEIDEDFQCPPGSRCNPPQPREVKCPPW